MNSRKLILTGILLVLMLFSVFSLFSGSAGSVSYPVDSAFIPDVPTGDMPSWNDILWIAATICITLVFLNGRSMKPTELAP